MKNGIVERKQGSETGHNHLKAVLSERQVKSVNFIDWEKIDEKEKQFGESKGKPREKITNISSIISTVDDKNK